MQKYETTFDWCIKNEKRIRLIDPNPSVALRHLYKARHNLKAAAYNQKGGFEDWAVSQAYYATYHALLAILFNKGFESKNHECTLTVVEHLIATKSISLSSKDIMFIRSSKQMTPSDAKSLREEFQYGTKTQVNKALLDDLLENSKGIVERIEIMLDLDESV